MSNRQKATARHLGRAPRPTGTVSSASHGLTVFVPTVWCEQRAITPCMDEKCGIKSVGKTAHFHPLAGMR